MNFTQEPQRLRFGVRSCDSKRIDTAQFCAALHLWLDDNGIAFDGMLYGPATIVQSEEEEEETAAEEEHDDDITEYAARDDQSISSTEPEHLIDEQTQSSAQNDDKAQSVPESVVTPVFTAVDRVLTLGWLRRTVTEQQQPSLITDLDPDDGDYDSERCRVLCSPAVEQQIWSSYVNPVMQRIHLLQCSAESDTKPLSFIDPVCIPVALERQRAQGDRTAPSFDPDVPHIVFYVMPHTAASAAEIADSLLSGADACTYVIRVPEGYDGKNSAVEAGLIATQWLLSTAPSAMTLDMFMLPDDW